MIGHPFFSIFSLCRLRIYGARMIVRLFFWRDDHSSFSSRLTACTMAQPQHCPRIITGPGTRIFSLFSQYSNKTATTRTGTSNKQSKQQHDQ